MTRLYLLIALFTAMALGSVTVLPGWRTVPALADAVGMSEWTLRKEIAEGRLRARRVGRCVRVLDEDAADWMRGRRDEAT